MNLHLSSFLESTDHSVAVLQFGSLHVLGCRIQSDCATNERR